MRDSLCVTGRLRVYETDLNRRFTRKLVDTHNLVVDDGLSAISRLLGGGHGVPAVGAGLTTYPLVALSGAAVGTMLLGTRDGLSPPTGGDGDLGPIPPGDVASGGGFRGQFSTAAGTLVVTYPSALAVTFTATADAGAWNAPNPPITEEMLLTEMGTVFARVVLSLPVQTTSSNGLAFIHDILLSRA
jgi:hypothetical protein